MDKLSRIHAAAKNAETRAEAKTDPQEVIKTLRRGLASVRRIATEQ